MPFRLENIEIDPDAARQYIDARSTFVELERTKRNAVQVRGGMVWKTVDGKEYLIRTSTTGGQNGLGRRSAQSEAMYQSFTEKKQLTEGRISGLKSSMAKHERMNRALKVGRMLLGGAEWSDGQDDHHPSCGIRRFQKMDVKGTGS